MLSALNQTDRWGAASLTCIKLLLLNPESLCRKVYLRVVASWSLELASFRRVWLGFYLQVFFQSIRKWFSFCNVFVVYPVHQGRQLWRPEIVQVRKLDFIFLSETCHLWGKYLWSLTNVQRKEKIAAEEPRPAGQWPAPVRPWKVLTNQQTVSIGALLRSESRQSFYVYSSFGFTFISGLLHKNTT